MESGAAASDHNTHTEIPERGEAYHGTSAFPWMGQYQATPVEAFPVLHGPIVHEGFVPDENDRMDLDNEADYNVNWSVPTSSTSLHQPRFTGSLGDHSIDRGSHRSLSETPRFVGFEDSHEGSHDSSSDGVDDDSAVSDDESQ